MDSPSVTEPVDFRQLCQEIKQLAGLTAEDEATLRELAALIMPSLDGVTDRLLAMLGTVPATAVFIEGRAEFMRKAYRGWLKSLFTRNLDADYVKWMYQVAAVHARVQLPVELMTAGMSLVQRELVVLVGAATLDAPTKTRTDAAIGAVCAFSQLVVQRSYGVARQETETTRARLIDDVSRKLFDKMAAVYREYVNPAPVFANDHRANVRARRRGGYATRTEYAGCRRHVPRSYP